MKLKKVKIVYFKEMLDITRDRRTIISMLLGPILIFPLLTLGFSKLAISQAKKIESQTHNIAVLGAENAPHLSEIIKKTPSFSLVDILKDSIAQAINDKIIRAAVEFPPNLEVKLQNEQNDSVKIYYDRTNDISREVVLPKLREILKVYSDSLIHLRLAEREVNPELLSPLKMKTENVASAKKMSGFLLALFLPYILVILALQSGMYPAIDLTAGEKERGTLETILVAPLSRLEISLGKFLTVLTATLVSTVLGTASMTISSYLGMAKIGELGNSFSITPEAALIILFLMFPLCCFFAGVLLGIALLAKSYKEAQSYLTPLMFVIILPAMTSFLPGFELSSKIAFIPIINTVMGIKETLLGNFHWDKLVIAFVSNSIFGGLGIYIAKRTFEKESVIFRV